MKPQRVIIILVCSALGLLGGTAYVKRSPSASSPAQTAAPAPEATVDERPQISSLKPEIRARAPEPKLPPFTWRQVESEDYKKYIANLRAIGCPEQTIRDIVIADVNKLYAAREAPLKSKSNALADTGKDVLADELGKRRQLREIQVEKRGVVKELLGIDLPLDLLPSSSSRDYDSFAAAFKFLPPEKRDAVQTLQENYWQQSDALKAKYKGQPASGDYPAEARQLSDSLRAELAKILTPRELEDYDLRTSPTAKKLTSQLATTFTPTEEEFRQIFRATRENEERLARVSSAPKVGPQATPEERQATVQARAIADQERAAIGTQFNEQLKSTLGDQRYDDYQRSQDSMYELLTRLGKRYGLDNETVLKAYDLVKSSQAQPGAGINFPQATKQVNVSGVPGATAATGIDPALAARQLNEQLTAVLGETAARGYRRVRGGGDTITVGQ